MTARGTSGPQGCPRVTPPPRQCFSVIHRTRASLAILPLWAPPHWPPRSVPIRGCGIQIPAASLWSAVLSASLTAFHALPRTSNTHPNHSPCRTLNHACPFPELQKLVVLENQDMAHGLPGPSSFRHVLANRTLCREASWQARMILPKRVCRIARRRSLQVSTHRTRAAAVRLPCTLSALSRTAFIQRLGYLKAYPRLRPALPSAILACVMVFCPATVSGRTGEGSPQPLDEPRRRSGNAPVSQHRMSRFDSAPGLRCLKGEHGLGMVRGWSLNPTPRGFESLQVHRSFHCASLILPVSLRWGNHRRSQEEAR